MNREFLSKIKEDDKHTYPFIEPFNKLFIDWTKVADFREPGVASKAFLRPLIRLCENSKMDDNTLKFIEVGNECLYANDNLIALKAFVKTNLDNMNKKLLQAGEILSKIVDKYDEIRTDNKEAPSFLNFLFRRT